MSAAAFFSGLLALCGQAFEGRVVSSDPVDAAMAAQRLVVHVRECSADEIRMPFHVGADRSRTWVLTRSDAGLRLEHRHRHEDGTPDPLTRYGGEAAPGGSARLQRFPADAVSRQLFRDRGRPDAVANTWTLELRPGALVYALARPAQGNAPARRFRVEFDLGTPVAPPPAPWGESPTDADATSAGAGGAR